MGGRFGRNRAATQVDPFYNAAPTGAYDPSGGLGGYGPYSQGYTQYEPTMTMGSLYGRPPQIGPTNLGGRYAQGINQMPGVSPWNYGNYYMGNTTMQMMPFMLNKVHQYGQMQAMAALGGAGLLGPNAMMPSMPYNMGASFMPMASPMMAAASPLPVAFNPLVQGMYPMASMSPANWMSPSSFMSALSSGPMPYRPPGMDFPNNVGMVMTVPYGTSNPLLSSSSSFGGFSPSYNFGGSSPSYNFGGSSPSYGFGGGNPCCSYFCCPPVAPPAPPTICYYPRPVSVPQPYAVPYPTPVAIPNIQQVPVQRSVPVVAPPIMAADYLRCSAPAGAPLFPSHGVFTQGGMGPTAVMSSNKNSTTLALLNNKPSDRSLPVYNTTGQSRSSLGHRLSSSLSNFAMKDRWRPTSSTPSKAKNQFLSSKTHDDISGRIRHYIPSIPRLSRSNYNSNESEPRSNPYVPPILKGELISDSGWLSKHSEQRTISSMLTGKRKKRPLHVNENGKSMLHSSGSGVSFLPRRRRRRHTSGSSVSEYDCAICQQQQEKRRLRKYYDSSTVSSLLSSPKRSRSHHLLTNESVLSSKAHTPPSSKQDHHKSNRFYLRKNKTSSSPSTKESSPVLLRQTPIQEQRPNETIHEEDEEKEKSRVDSDSDADTDDN